MWTVRFSSISSNWNNRYSFLFKSSHLILSHRWSNRTPRPSLTSLPSTGSPITMSTSLDAPLGFLTSNPISNAVSDAFRSFNNRRAQLGLSNPGTIENISKEVQREVSLSNYMHSGLRADLTKAISLSPLFQVSHQFALGEQMKPYAFAALYGVNNVRLFIYLSIH